MSEVVCAVKRQALGGTGMNLLFTIVLGSLLLTGCSRPEIHLLREGAKGDVFILVDYSNGARPQREGLAKVFEIPPNLILVTQDQPGQGWHTTKYFYLTPTGERRALDYEGSSIHPTPENLADERPMVWFERTGEIRDSALPCPIRFLQYYVGTRADLLSRSNDETNAQELRLKKSVRENRICP